MASWLTSLDPANDPHHTIRLSRHLGGEGDGWWQGFDLVKGCVVIRLDKSFSQHLQVGQTIWVWGFQETQPNLITAMTSKGATIVVRPPENDEHRTGHAVELFAGFGGWAMGGELMGTKPVISVERDGAVAKAASIQHGCPVLEINEVWNNFMKTGKIELGCIWVADVFDPRVMMLLSIIQVDHLWGSPPCQPWSSMATQAGLSTVEGRYIPATFCLGNNLGVQSINLENVKGFRTHAHYEDTMRFAEKMRFCRAQESVDDCTGVLPLSRSRWLGCFLSQATLVEHITLDRIRYAREVGFPEDLFLGGMRGCDAIFHELPKSECDALTPDHNAMEYLKDTKLIPTWWKAKPITPEETLKARTISPKGPLIGMVASYGRQHEFDYQYLCDKGLHTMVMKTPDGHRYVSPWEQVACLGFPASTTLPNDHRLAWHILGNSLSTAHAVLQLYRAHTILGAMSPFKAWVPSLPTLCRKMQRLSLRLSNKQVYDCGNGYSRMGEKGVTHGAHIIDQKDITEVEQKPEEEHQCKRARIHSNAVSPTMSFTVESPKESEKRKEDVDQRQSSRGQGVQFLPAAQDVEIDRMLVEVATLDIGDEAKTFQPAAISSKTSRWVQIVWGPPNVEVQSLIHFALPHGQDGLIDQVEVRGKAVEMRSVLNDHPPHIVRFRPVHVACQVRIEFAQQDIIEEANVTTTVSQWIANFAGRLNVDPMSLVLWGDGKPMVVDAYVLECGDHRSFSIRWRPVIQPCPKRCLHIKESETTWPNPGIKCGHRIGEASSNLIRLAVVHPLWKSIRTIAVDHRCTIIRAIQTLVPDLAKGSPIVEAGSCIVDPTIEIQAVAHEHVLMVDLNNMNATPRLVVEIVPQCLDPSKVDWGVDSLLAPFKRYIRSPFRVHGCEYKLPGECTLLKLGASFFCQSEACQTLLVTSNCRTVDPHLTIRETCEKDVISFRAVPLPGGAKKDLTQHLTTQLVNRGVPQDNVKERVKQIMDEIPADQLKALPRDDDNTFWQSLKKLATENRVRLITNGELKLHQKEQRAKKPEQASASSVKAKPNKATHPKIDIAQVKIELMYLEADDRTPVKVLSPEEFGQDKTGVVLMTVEEASHYLPVKRMSVQPLALLVIAGPDTPADQVQMLPALDRNSTPILLPIQIVNFGDVNIQLVPGKNKASAITTVTHVVETVIRRNLVEDWGSTKDPVQYIGKHVNGFSNGALVAHFAFKTYGPSKQVVPHDKGQYYHGYLRIKNEPLEEILKSSGKSGIFLVPKGDNKRPDPAFVVIPSCGETLEKMMAQCKKHAVSLGVVEYGNGYAYRAKRENVIHARKVLLPNAVWAEEGEPRPGDSMWVVKHVPNDVAGPQLTNAFKEMGWDAVAVKPYSATTWSVSAQTRPPSPHIFINGAFAVAVLAGGAKTKTLASFVQHGFPTVRSTLTNIDRFALGDEDMDKSTIPSRTDEIKVEMSEQIEQVVRTRMQDTQDHVNRLEQAIRAQDAKLQQMEETTSISFQQVQAQQQHTEERLGGIEQQVGGISQTVVQQMNSMLQTMTTTLMGRLDALEGDAKRQRKTDAAPY